MSRFSDRTALCNIICAVLMIILLVLQFMPFWTYGEGQTASISDYIWWPEENRELESYMKTHFGDDFHVWEIVGMPVAILGFGVIGTFFCIIKSDNPWVSFLPAACGLAGVWGYLCKPAFQLGANWQLHLALSILILVAAVIGILFGFKEQIKAALSLKAA